MNGCPALIAALVPLSLSTLASGCHLILGLDEYSLRTSCPTAECGVFVSLGGSDSNSGTREDPVRTISRAIEISLDGNKIVQACAQEFFEPVVVPGGVTLKGGRNCNGDWEYIGALVRTTIVAGPDAVPLRLLGTVGATRIEDIDIRASDATLPGGSSVAVIADGATAEFARCDFTAGNGMAGDKGATPMEPVGPTDSKDPAIRGVDGSTACMGGASGNAGGDGAINALCSVSFGGKGGSGGLAALGGEAGANGEPAGDLNKGLGGTGDPGTGCDVGGGGQAGTPGVSGAGATGPGTISVSGFVGAAGEPGSPGGHGQGGGGGGGAKGKVGCNGASGGGGGSGGCGGNGGLGGLGGGSSIALLSLNATISFEDVNLKGGNGGVGGEGGDGQPGGLGGFGGSGGLGMGTNPACDGGKGGFGGLGGKGGGGRGGHSIGIAFTGKAPPKATKFTAGMPGTGGLGADMTTDGALGEAKESLEFPAAAP